MLDQIDLDQTIDHREYKTRIADLQARLYAMEQELFESRVPAIFVFEGWAGAAKVRTIQALTHRLDPRGVRVHPITPPRTSEAAFPWLHRFWLKTPSYGQIAIFDRSWYRQVIAERSKNAPAEAGRDRCEDIVAFERMLADDGATILKFWLHISKDEQKRRFAKLLADPLTAWQVTDDDRWQQRHYKRVRDAVEFVLTRTDTPHAPWVVVPANSKHYARITVLESILAALEARLGQSTPPSAPPTKCCFAQQHPPPLGRSSSPRTNATGASKCCERSSSALRPSWGRLRSRGATHASERRQDPPCRRAAAR
jgi:polyphosphate kinase 2 (PPK2 family)